MIPVVTRGMGRQRHSAFALLTLLLATIFTLGWGVESASAHAELLGTTPEDGAVLDRAPAAAEFPFSEPVQLIDGGIRLFPGVGDPVILNARVVNSTITAALPDDLSEGFYTLSYRVVSADGHPISGAITFQVGTEVPTSPSPPPETTAVTPSSIEFTVSILTVLQYIGLLMFAGLLLFDRIVLRTRAPADLDTRRVWRIGLATAICASLLLIPASALRVMGAAPWMIASPGTWLPGVLWQPVVSALVILVTGLAAYLLAARSTSGYGGRTSVIVAAIAVAAPVLAGHTQTVEPSWLIMSADIGHLLAGAFWVGGVAGLLRFLARVRQFGTSPRTAPEFAARVTVRFSRFSLCSVILLALSGTVMAVMIVGDLPTLVDTGYGRNLLLKFGIVIAVITLAAWNRTRLLPRIIQKPTVSLQWASLRRILGYEAALLIAVLIITGFLTNSSPSHHGMPQSTTSAARDITVHADSQGLLVDGSFSPTATGQNTITFRLKHNGVPVTPDQVHIEARLPERELGPFTGTPELDPRTGHYTAVLTLPVSGDWQILITARVSTYEQPIALIPVTIP